jgi:hypothetical protein
MKVVAKKGTRCPKENNPREYIDDTHPVDVPESIYYQRLVQEGSLVIFQQKQKEEVKNGK